MFFLLSDFKKASAADQPKLFASLLKSYQEEVDNLTKRAKYGEAAFLGVYQKMYEAPDPVPALASAAVSRGCAVQTLLHGETVSPTAVVAVSHSQLC